MKKYYYIGIAVLALLITTAAVSVATFAFSKSGHDWKAGRTWDGKNYQVKSQFMADMTYEEWEAMMQKKVQAMRDKADELESQITEENYEIMLEIYRLKAEGDMEGVKALMEDSDMFGDYDKKAGYMMGGHWKK